MNYCRHCKRFLADYEVVEHETSEPSEFWGALGITRHVERLCPCGDELDECHPCERCGDAPAVENDHCRQCNLEIEAEERAAVAASEARHRELRKTLLDIARCFA